MNLEIDVTLECNCRCSACNRLCDIVPKNPQSVMTLDDVKQIYGEIKNYEFDDYVAVIGGEPTTNPNIMEILDFLDKQKFKIKSGKLLLVTNGLNDPVIRKVLERKYKQIYVDFYDNSISEKYASIYGTGNIVKRRRTAKNSNRSDTHLNFLYGEKDGRHLPFFKCKVFNRCGKGAFKLHGKVWYYHNTACKSLCILLGKEHLFKQHFKDLFDDVAGMYSLNSELCPYCVLARRKQIYWKNDQHISEMFQRGIEKYKAKISDELSQS